MMVAKTTHIIPISDGWTVKKERADQLVEKRGSRQPAGNPRAARLGAVYPTQKQAIEAARRLVRDSTASQIVVHTRTGSMRWLDVRGLPLIQASPVKSTLGTEAIKKAVSTVIRERLKRD